MQLKGQKVKHVKFGKGIIKEAEDKKVTIAFEDGEKKFVYPEAFFRFLEFDNKKAQDQIDQQLGEIKERADHDLRMELKKQESRNRLRSLKIHPQAQAVFGLIQNEKEEVFENWCVYAGENQSGPSKGKVKLPTRMKMNTVCLITECQQKKQEAERKIIGAFMVCEDFDGRNCTDGKIAAHDFYRIQLNQKEEISYWQFFEKEEQSMQWGSVEIRYISNEKMMEILEAIMEAVSTEEKHQSMKEFCRYFRWANKWKNADLAELDIESEKEAELEPETDIKAEAQA